MNLHILCNAVHNNADLLAPDGSTEKRKPNYYSQVHYLKFMFCVHCGLGYDIINFMWPQYAVWHC